MPDQECQRAIELSRRIAAEVGTPRFYIEKAKEVSLSGDLLAAEPLIAAALRVFEEGGGYPGHGPAHVRKVAVDIGALILIESERFPPNLPLRRLVLLAHLAGILHDIRRKEENHAERGAQEAEHILASFPLRNDECAAITGAIRNHEAFRDCRATTGPAAQFLSDSLYDADKFRWGPDNFTETLWAMIAQRRVPLRIFLPRFLPGIQEIEKIRGSFRTPTGREYGPDFIDRGLTIGRRLHAELTGNKP